MPSRRLSANQSLFILLTVSLAIKLIMAYVTPLTADEAYYVQWGEYPAFGYYDHPPMIGWLMWLMLTVSKSQVWVRLPIILGETLIGWMIYKIVEPRDKQLAVLAAGLFLMSPLLIFPWITTDTPLIILSFLSAACFYKALENDSMAWYFLCGLLLGAAYMSKYFAGLLGLAYLGYIVFFVRRGFRPYLGILVLLLGVAPFMAANLSWNYSHCWDNYLFNLQNRTASYSASWRHLLNYALGLLYLLTPPVIYYLIRRSGRMLTLLRTDRMGVFLVLYLIPIIIFIPISLGKNIGLHWTLSFYPFIFIALALLLDVRQLRISFYFMLGFSALQLIAFSIVWPLSPGLFKGNPSIYQALVFAKHSDDLYKLIKPYRHGAALASPSYAAASIMDVEGGEHVLVFGAGSLHGREDDLLTNYRDYDKKDLVIFSYYPDVNKDAKYFQSFKYVVLPYEGTKFYLGIGTGFKYAVYQKDVIEPIQRRYYHIPSWLPHGECYMDARIH